MISLRDAFGHTLVKLASRYDFFCVDADVAGGTGAHHFREAYPERFIQAGIMEQAATGLAAGLASIGKPVFLCLFSQFALRAFEIAMLSIAYSNRNVKIVLSHCGVESGEDGSSNQSINHYAVWRTIPNMSVYHPSDSAMLELIVESSLLCDAKPSVLFTGRNPQPLIYKNIPSLGRSILHGDFPSDITIIATGVMTYRGIVASRALREEHGIQSVVVDMNVIKPIDSSRILRCALKTGAIVTCEDHSIIGGLGSAVAEVTSRCCPVPIEMVGIKDEWGQSGGPEELAEFYHLTSDDIVKAALRVIERKKAGYDEIAEKAYRSLG